MKPIYHSLLLSDIFLICFCGVDFFVQKKKVQLAQKWLPHDTPSSVAPNTFLLIKDGKINQYERLRVFNDIASTTGWQENFNLRSSV
jgi:hypothetical protein